MFNSSSTTYFSRVLKLLRLKNLYPSIATVTGPSSNPEIVINGKKYITFCSNNYLGLANNEQIKKEVEVSIRQYGVGSGSTRLLSGTLDVQVDFEKKLADFYGFSDAITFSSGFLANAGVIRMLVDPFPYFSVPFGKKKSVIFSDELNHASIIDSVRLARAERVVYRHNDVGHLEELLKKYKNYRKLVVTDGIFSMDGDMAPLSDITKLAHKYDAMTFVDDSHGVGVLGPKGEGVCHHLGVQKDVDVIMGSFTKAWGSIGGFVVVNNKDVADYLRITARSYIFSDPILPAVVKGLITALDIIKDGSVLREKTLNNAAYLRGELKGMGFEVLGELVPIVPPILGSEKKAIQFSQKLDDVGVLAPAVRRPAVSEGQERLRLTTMANHSKKHIDYLLENMEKIGKELKII